MKYELPIIHPSWPELNALKVKLTDGEYALAKFLDDYLPQLWEIYAQPFLNGDRPDIIVLNPQI